MVFPEHMEFRYYVTPERKEHFALYDRTLGSRMTYLDQTQDLGQCLIDLYDTDFYDAYCTLAEINKSLPAYSRIARSGSTLNPVRTRATCWTPATSTPAPRA